MKHDGDKHFTSAAHAAAHELVSAPDSRSTLVHMDPGDFLKLANHHFGSPRKVLRASQDYDANGGYSAVPYLKLRNRGDRSAQVTGHEGRHRSLALRSAGVKSMPVVLEGTSSVHGALRWGARGKKSDPVVGDWPTHMVGQDGRYTLPIPHDAFETAAGKPALKDLFAASKARLVERRALAEKLSSSDRSVRYHKADGQSALVGRDMSKPGGWRVTHFDHSRVPNGHSEHTTPYDAHYRALEDGYRPAEKAAVAHDGDAYFSENAHRFAHDQTESWRSRTTLTHMHPQTFLDLAKHGHDPAKEARVRAAGGNFSDIPMLQFDNHEGGHAHVTGHEGRHRARFLLSKGVKSMPVMLHSNNGHAGGIRWGDGPHHNMPHTIHGEGNMRSHPMPHSETFPGAHETADASKFSNVLKRARDLILQRRALALKISKDTSASNHLDGFRTAPGIEDVYKRRAQAHDHLVESVKHHGKLNDEDARSVANHYLKHKIATLDSVGGRSRVKHGGFLDHAVIHRALQNTREHAPGTRVRAMWHDGKMYDAVYHHKKGNGRHVVSWINSDTQQTEYAPETVSVVHPVRHEGASTETAAIEAAWALVLQDPDFAHIQKLSTSVLQCLSEALASSMGNSDPMRIVIEGILATRNLSDPTVLLDMFGNRSEVTASAETHTVPESVKSAARRGIALRAKHGKGGIGPGQARARQLVSGKPMQHATVMRMHNFFTRHIHDREGKNWDAPSSGKIAHLLWGGNAGQRWAAGIAARHKREKEAAALSSSYPVEHISDARFPNYHQYVFQSPHSGIKYRTQIVHGGGAGKERNHAHLSFNPIDTSSYYGTSHAEGTHGHRVLASVKAVVQRHLADHPHIKTIQFESDDNENRREGSKEGNRTRLYRRLVKSVAHHHIEVSKGDQHYKHTKFTVHRKDLKHTEHNAVETADIMAPLYVHRPLINIDDLQHWADEYDLGKIDAESHVTVVYSKTPVDWMAMPYSGDSEALTVPAGGPRAIDAFGGENNVIVLRFVHPDLNDRAQQLLDAGCTSDFPDYKSHVTLFGNPDKSIDPTKLKPYSGPLVFGPEIFGPTKDTLDDDDDKKETSADHHKIHEHRKHKLGVMFSIARQRAGLAHHSNPGTVLNEPVSERVIEEFDANPGTRNGNGTFSGDVCGPGSAGSPVSSGGGSDAGGSSAGGGAATAADWRRDPNINPEATPVGMEMYVTPSPANNSSDSDSDASDREQTVERMKKIARGIMSTQRRPVLTDPDRDPSVLKTYVGTGNQLHPVRIMPSDFGLGE